MGLLNPAIAAIFATIFAGLWLRDRTSRDALILSIGHALLATGFLIFHFTPEPNAISWTLLMHTVYTSSSICTCWAAAHRVGQKINVTAFVAIGLITAVIIAITSFGTDMNPRLIATNTAYGLMVALTVQILGRAPNKSPFDQAIFWLFIVTAAQFFIRPQLAMILSGPMSAEAYRDSDFYAVWMLMMGIVSLLVSLTLVAGIVYDQWRAVSEKAEIDPLSQLKMRRSFESAAMELLENNVDRNVPVCMIVADIDHFKRVNDIWGHQAGDSAISAFGALISRTVRATDLTGRVGGEEFCIIVYDCDVEPAKRLAERIRSRFATLEHAALGPDIRITASFGVTQWRPGEGYGKLFARADAALYQAKSRGRDRVEVDALEDKESVVTDSKHGIVELKHASVP